MLRLLLVSFFSMMAFLATAQDSTQTMLKGSRLAFDVGLLENKSLQDIRQQLQQAGIDPSRIGRTTGSTTISFVRDRPRDISEIRLLVTNSQGGTSDVNYANKLASFYGYGVGLTNTIKLVNTPRFIIGPFFGYDLMWYRLRIVPQNSQNLNLGNVVANPAAYSTVTLRQLAMNLAGGLHFDYRTGWLKRVYSDVRLGARVGYQLPLVRSKNWLYDDSVVSDLPGFRSNSLFAQFGITIFWKQDRK